MDILTNLRTFLMVARCGGFSKAARNLHVVPSVVAKRVAQLEYAVGVPLFNRTTRSTRLTEGGEQLRIRATALVDSFDAVVQGLKPEEKGLTGTIRLSAPATFTIFHLNKVFAEFLAKHPNVHLEVLLLNRSINPSETGLDMVISGRTAAYEGITEFPLMPISPVLCASPAYISARGLPDHPRGLSSHDCLVFRPHGGHWLFQSSKEGVIDVDVSRARMVADDNLTLLEAAKAGCGLAIIPRNYARTSLADGSLKAVLPGFPPNQNWMRVLIPHSKVNLPRVKALLDHLKSRMSALQEDEEQSNLPVRKTATAKARLKRRSAR